VLEYVDSDYWYDVHPVVQLLIAEREPFLNDLMDNGGFGHQIALLLKMIELSNLGGIATVECNNLQLRRRLFRYFDERLAEKGILLYPLRVDRHDLNLVRVLRNITDQPGFKDLELLGRYRRIVFFVYGLEEYTPRQQKKFLEFLNLFRDATTIIKEPIIIWAIWSWKGLLFTFEADTPLEFDEAMLPVDQSLYNLARDPSIAVWSEVYVPLNPPERATCAFV